jgi:hypothetical protein
MIGLLVGIDEYLGGVTPLRGCRNDIQRAREVLARRAKAEGMASTFTVLLDEQATRDGLIRAFRATFAAAGPGDTAVFYYSGHGSQQEAPPEHLVFEPDGLDETLVLHDSRADAGYDLADVELGVLVREITAHGAHAFIILDCCHSGSGLREADGAVTGIRRAPTARARRPADSYLRAAGDAPPPEPGARFGVEGYVLLAACRSDQTAKEVRVGDGLSRGVLSVAFEAAVTTSTGHMTYLQLQRMVAASVAGLVSDQTPVLECRPPSDADRLVLGGIGGDRAPLHVATHGPGGWRFDAGSLHGLPSVSFAHRPIMVTLHDLTAAELYSGSAVARAHVTIVRATTSDLAVDEGAETLDIGTAYRVVVRELPADVTVAVDAHVPGRDTVVAALEQGAGLSVVHGTAPADLAVIAAGKELRLTRPGVTRPLVATRPLAVALGPAQLGALRDEATQVGRWLSLARRRNPTTRLAPAEVILELLDTADHPMPIDPDGTVQVLCPPHGWPRARIRVTNRSSRRLFVSVLVLSELYGVSTLLEGEGEWLDAGTAVYVPAWDGTPDIYFYLPGGAPMTTDVLMVIAATEEFSSTSLRQDDLAPPARSTPTRSPDGASKGISATPPPQPTERLEDWTTTQLRVRTYRPGELQRLSAGRPATLGGDVIVLPHPAVTASARLVPGTEAVRNSLVSLLPSVLVDAPDSLPFSFLPMRSAAGAVDVLEMHDVQRPETVTADEPLVLRVPQNLGPEEVVLPIMFDGEDYLPIGLGVPDGDVTQIQISRLPTQGEVTTRSLGGALKILFRKLAARRPGCGPDWPRLSLVTYDTTGNPSYEHDPAAMRAALAGTRTALLFVHGIIRETIGMARAAGPAGRDLCCGMDAVLALDYENLGTSIERSGSDLAAALARVGVVPGEDGPRLTIVAHSTGGLVCRCFIEHHGGAAVTDRLITCGTPHRGSPWPQSQGGPLAMLGFTLNLPVAADGPGAAVGSALTSLGLAAERFGTSLDEMRPGSDLLQTLATAPDPGVPHTAVVGTQPLPDSIDEDRAARIVRKLTGTAIEVVFAGERNDIVVSLASASGVGSSWPQGGPRILNAACNHMSYFCNQAGLDALAQALQV